MTARVVICCGSGGVGKTTTSAALSIRLARAGARVAVLTIDPARRLADALSVGEIGNTAFRVPLDGLPQGASLHAMMLDSKRTFDDVVERFAGGPEARDRILKNHYYRFVSTRLAGSHEYMAMEKLYELHEEHDFDLVVVDTPPTRNALDFLEAPRRLTHFLDHRLYRILMAPGRGVLKAVNVAAQAFLRTVSKVVGAEVVEDALTFFQAFEGMEEGFRDRAARVLELLSHDETAFVLVTAPRRDVVEEATFFAAKLLEADIPVRALIVNRVHPHFGDAAPEAVRERARTHAGTDLGGLYENLADFLTIAATEESHLAGLAAKVAPAPVVRVPFLDSDVHDLEGLGHVAAHLFVAERTT